MTVLSPKFEGFIHICNQCYAVLAYTPQDIYENKYIYCPVCRTKNEIPIELNYEGLKEKEK